MPRTWLGYLLVLAPVLFGCAEPKYIVSSGTSGDKAEASRTESRCEAQFKESKLCLTWWWVTKPDLETYGVLIFKVFRQNKVDGSDVLTDLDGDLDLIVLMPDMDHLPTPTILQKLDVGTYEASDIFFNMPGRWELRFLQKKQTQVDEARVVYDF